MADLGAFPVGTAKQDLKQAAFQDNYKSWINVLSEFETNLENVCSEGDEASQRRHQDRGQLLARDRIALLLDHDSPFLELGQFAGFGLDSTPSASLIAGIGKACGKICMFLCHIPSIKGGAWNEFTILKHNRVTEIANENRLPIVILVQAAGVFLPQQFRVFHKTGQIFRDMARRSQNGMPTCSVVFGSSTAGGAYLPGMSDHTIFVRNQAQVFLGGPPLVKMATGEVVVAEELGGAEMHATITGLADEIASDEFDALRKARQWLHSLEKPSLHQARHNSLPAPPRYPIGDLLYLVNTDIRKPFDMREVVLRLVDDSRAAVFKPEYGKNLLTCYAEIHGHPVGILGNQTPVIRADDAVKGAQFIRLCNQRNIPIVFLHNVTGFMVGLQSEKAGIIKKGAQLVSAVSCSKVPHISIVLGSSYGAGNYAMCGRAYSPRFLFSWPSSRCSVMGPDQLAGVMGIIQDRSNERKAAVGEKAQQTITAAVQAQNTKLDVERQSKAYYTSAHLLDDGIIHPYDTREVLGMCLEIVDLEGVEGASCHRGLARLPPSKRYVEALQERIRNLESQLESLGQPVARPESRYSGLLDDNQSDVEEDKSLSDDAESTRRSPMREISNRLGDLNIGEDGQVHYFGSRSNFSLLKTGHAVSSIVSASELERQAACTLDQLGLRVQVSNELRDHLLDIFWTWQNTWQYIVIKEPFLDDLCGQMSGQYASPLLLSAVLALAARYSDRLELRSDPLDPNTAGNALAEQAKMILFYESQAPKVTTIQAAALLSLRETATNKEALGWMYCGIATRMAFNLGLHLDCSHWCETGRITKEAAELRGVVWWGCYVLDKLFNVGLGRPSTIQESEISAPLPSTDQSAEFGPWATTSLSGQQIEFASSFVISNVRATVRLFNITAPALDEIYRPSKRRLSPHVKDLLTKTHVALMEFQTNLPSCLRLSMSALRPTLPHSYLLHLQYHVAVILLHRPFIGVRKNSLGLGDLHPNADVIHLRECTKSAQSISNIFKLYQRHYTLRRIPISAVHCAFTASIILLLMATSSDSADRCNRINSLRILADALTHMSVAWAWSQRALEAIRQLAREWLLSEDVMEAIGIGEAQTEITNAVAVPDALQEFDIGDFDVPLWTSQDAQNADLAMSSNIDVSWLNQEIDLQGWMDAVFTEPDFPNHFL
ncbi:hypothetical protein VTL71DRAFT_11311 [Oculimacula yallundae]|uniref:methylcrotonoyl-CoA carboxylase n=1 Tax=Oculimacula yallundae TaxID=86028 RepID=A0ABR4CQE0_9HELO